LGGSFNPAHLAHRHISLIALRRMKLDAVWWLVSPQNPLKSASAMAPLGQRLLRARDVAKHPRIHVSSVEVALGARYTIDTISALKAHFPLCHFVWLMGGDSLASFHLWRRWPDIARAVPIGVIARPTFTISGISSPAARRLAGGRILDPAKLAGSKPPAWSFVQERLDPTSATQLRDKGGWP
jgi:nicotinate-nucleotide adenylyltransferase